MPGDPKSKEWNLLKDQFDALVHDESVREDSIETFFDHQIRRRFGEWITRARERKNRTEMTPSRRRPCANADVQFVYETLSRFLRVCPERSYGIA
jgi:hypothetical protein